jgi:hypothetical protein
MTIASATAASAAASTITKMLKTWPSKFSIPPKRLNAIKLILAEFRISSIPIRMAIAFFRVITPYIPIENNIAAMIKYD